MLIYNIWNRISWTLLRLVLENLLQTQIPQGDIFYNHWPTCLICFFPPFLFWSGHKIPLCHENRIQLYHDNQKSVKNMLYDTGLALMLGFNHLKAERKNVVKHWNYQFSITPVSEIFKHWSECLEKYLFLNAVILISKALW